MKQIYFLFFSFFVSFSFAQEKSYRFVYDFHQNTELDEDSKKGYSRDFMSKIQHALNESYEFEVIAMENFSFLKLKEKIKNEQTEGVIRLEPEPKWLLIDFQKNETFNFSEVSNSYVKDSVQSLSLKPTRNKKVILGIEAKEYTADFNNYNYTLWLAQQNGITVSPVDLQFKNYIVLEFEMKNQAKENETSEYKHYILKEIIEEKSPFNYKKLIPKKTITKEELKAYLDKMHEEIDNSVDK